MIMIRISPKVKISFLYKFVGILAVLMLLSIVSCGQTAVQQSSTGETAAVAENTAAGATASETTIAGATTTETTIDETINFVGSANVKPLSAPVGSSIIVSGTGLPSNQSVDVVWNTFEGSWDIQGEFLEEYHGRIFKGVKQTISTVQTDAKGSFQQAITVPEDYGFNHNITIEQGGKVLNRVGFSIETTASINQTSGPLGTPITIIMTGIGTQTLENSWTVSYDNKFTGVITAVNTKGTATAIIPATGGSGKHIIRVIHGAFQFPYLNTQQSPQPDRPVFSMEFTVTDGEPVLPPPVENQGLSIKNGNPPADATTKPILWSDPMEGPIKTEATLHGSGFSPGKEVKFQWATVAGNRVSRSGWEKKSTELGKATAGEDGNLTFSFTIPDDLGGQHLIDAITDDKSVATTSFTIKPTAFPLEVSSGPVGTKLTLHLKGIGWTETANIYTIVYDNAYLGYACGFNSQGDVTVYMPLTGEPGWHFIDLYPAIYKGVEMAGTQIFRIPQLTYQKDHPGEQLPAFHFAVQVTK